MLDRRLVYVQRISGRYDHEDLRGRRENYINQEDFDSTRDEWRTKLKGCEFSPKNRTDTPVCVCASR